MYTQLQDHHTISHVQQPEDTTSISQITPSTTPTALMNGSVTFTAVEPVCWQGGIGDHQGFEMEPSIGNK
jgi:hypothetical protein